MKMSVAQSAQTTEDWDDLELQVWISGAQLGYDPEKFTEVHAIYSGTDADREWSWEERIENCADMMSVFVKPDLAKAFSLELASDKSYEQGQNALKIAAMHLKIDESRLSAALARVDEEVGEEEWTMRLAYAYFLATGGKLNVGG